MATKIYDGAMRILKALIAEYRKEGMTDADIIDSLDFAKKDPEQTSGNYQKR